jgi:spore germination protein PE
MFQRISKVKSLTTQSLLFSASIQIGDCSFIDGISSAIAVQRRSNIIYEYENQFSDYKIFAQPTILPIIDEQLQTRFENQCPFIEVGNIRIIGFSTASVASIGNVGHIRMNSRIQHIRQLV